ncbi:MAG: TonB-dependent receptor [Novosphingobium sp.]
MRILCTLPVFALAAPALAAETAAPPVSTESDTADGTMPVGDEIVVVATRFKGQVVAPQRPVITLDAPDIAAYGASSLDELVGLIAPQTGSGRGRGDGRPVFLLNGRRVSNFRELRSIPPEAIRRLEVLPEEVALRYGYPPDQRVVNFILQDNFRLTTATAAHDRPTLGGFSATRLEATLLRLSGPRRLNLAATYQRTTALTEAERSVLQPPANRPTVAGDPDPAAFRSLIDASRGVFIDGNWSTGLGGENSGGSITLTGGYTRRDTRALRGLDTVLLTAPSGATAVRALADPLVTNTHQDTVEAGATLNMALGGWQLTGTLNSSLDSTRTQGDRRADTTPLVAAAAIGGLAITGPLPALVLAGSDRAEARSLTLNSLVTLAGQPFRLPAGEAALTVKAGYAYVHTRSTDTRGRGPTVLTRGDLSTGVNLALPLTSRRERFLDAIGDVSLDVSAGLDRLSDFGTLVDWSAGLTWNPTPRLGLQASWIVNEQAPTLAQLGGPTILAFNVPIFDFSRSEAALVTITSGGNPTLRKQSQRDLKLSANWQLPFLERSNLLLEYFRNRSDDVTQSFPLLTPAIEAAFPGRAVRDASGRLISIDRRPVTFSQTESARLRWGINLSGRIGAEAAARSGGGALGGRGRAGGVGRPGGGGPGVGAMPGMMGREGGRGGRWNLSLTHTLRLDERVRVSPAGPSLDLLGGDALAAGGVARHTLSLDGGAFYQGLGLRVNGSWSAPVRVSATGAPGSSDLRFGSVFDLDLRAFVDFDRRPKLIAKAPFLKGARLTFKVQNLLNSRQKVTDAVRAVPLAYQPDYLDPRGRMIGVDFRKTF